MYEVLQTVCKLGIILGRDCQFSEDFNLKIPIVVLDRLIEEGLKNPDTALSPQPSALSPQPPAERIDRVIELSSQQQIALMQIENQFQIDWLESDGSEDLQRKARRTQQIAKRQLRDDIVLPYATGDLVISSSLVYGAMLPMVASLGYPDGRAFTVEALIHFSHPTSPEDLYLREKRVTAKRIYRYRIPGLDDAEWMRQNEPRGPLDAKGWRDLMRTRLLS